jgi:hypothetical protein
MPSSTQPSTLSTALIAVGVRWSSTRRENVRPVAVAAGAVAAMVVEAMAAAAEEAMAAAEEAAIVVTAVVAEAVEVTVVAAATEGVVAAVTNKRRVTEARCLQIT